MIKTLEQIASDIEDPLPVPDNDRAAVLEGLEQAQRDEYASDADVDALLNERWSN